MVLTPRQFCENWWREVFKKVKKAAVFIDGAAADNLHWNGGLFRLIAAGAVSVREFSSFEKGDDSQKKAVFLTASPLVRETRMILRDLIQSSSFEYCVLMTGVDPSVHQFAKYGRAREGTNDMAAFHSLEEEMLHWMGNMNYTVEIFYVPMFMVQVSHGLVLMPPFHKLFPLSEADMSRVRELYSDHIKHTDTALPDTLSAVEPWMLPAELQVCLRYLVTSLHVLFTQMDVHEDIFSLGHLSGIVAALLEALPAAVKRRKTAPNRCSLIVVDRSLDLCTAASHASESLLDRIVGVLPRLPGHSSDVAIDMSPLCNAKVSNVLEDVVVAPGCLAHSEENCLEVMEWLVTKRHKDVLLGLHQLLVTMAPGTREDHNSRLAPRVSANTLEKQVAAFKGKPEDMMQHSGLLQQTLAVVQSLKSWKVSRREQLLSLEKLLFLSVATTRNPAGVLEQVRRLVQTRRERGLALEDLLSILVHIYSLAGTAMRASLVAPEERELRAALRWALQQDRMELPSGLRTLVPPDGDEAAVDTAADRIMERLHGIAQARKDLSTYRFAHLHYLGRSYLREDIPHSQIKSVEGESTDGESVVTPPHHCIYLRGGGMGKGNGTICSDEHPRSLVSDQEDVQKAVHSGLLQRLISDLVDPARPDIADLACRSAGLKELLKSSFSMLLNRPRQQHPLDSPLVILLVLGGVTAQEVRVVQETVANSTLSAQVLVASTRLITPIDIVEAVFVKDALMQDGDS